MGTATVATAQETGATTQGKTMADMYQPTFTVGTRTYSAQHATTVPIQIAGPDGVKQHIKSFLVTDIKNEDSTITITKDEIGGWALLLVKLTNKPIYKSSIEVPYTLNVTYKDGSSEMISTSFTITPPAELIKQEEKQDTEQEKTGLSPAAIGGIVAGVVALLGLISGGIAALNGLIPGFNLQLPNLQLPKL